MPTTPPNIPRGPSANGHANLFSADLKGKGKEVPPFVLPITAAPSHPRLPVGGPGEMINVAAEYQDGVSRLVDMSVACRYLAAQCQVRQGKWADATEMLGEANPFRASGSSGATVPNMDGGIKVSCFFLL